jgi:cation diffusion facilitator family transporter
VLLRQGRALRSPALVADGRHVLTDVVSSAGVLLGVVLAIATGWAILDPLLALGVAANIVWSGLRLIRESIGGLMDEALPTEMLALVKQVLAENREGALETHDLRTRQAGQRMFVEYHLVVPGAWSVRDAHDLCDRMEEALRTALGGEVMVTIHVEPEHKAKHV